jgi:hypothetical protein
MDLRVKPEDDGNGWMTANGDPGHTRQKLPGQPPGFLPIAPELTRH